MVAYYNVFGMQVGSHILSMATLGSTGAISWYFMRGDKKPAAPMGARPNPSTGAGSKEEEAFINEFLKNSEAEEKKAKQ